MEQKQDDSCSSVKEKTKRRGGTYCVAGGPNKTSCKNSVRTHRMHRFPKDLTIREKWVKFVRRYRTDFNIAQYSEDVRLCSAHFERDCYSRPLLLDITDEEKKNTKMFLFQGSVPTLYPNPVKSPEAQTEAEAEKLNETDSISKREKRRVRLLTYPCLSWYMT